MVLYKPKVSDRLRSRLVRAIGFPATLIHGDTTVLDRWLWLRRYLGPVPRGSKALLDVGCGTGAFTIGAARMGYRALGLNWDERSQRVAVERAAFCHADLAKFELQDLRKLDDRPDLRGQFDVAICLECIEHILNDRKLMIDVARCLRPGGILLLTTPNFDLRPMTSDDAVISPVENGLHVRRGYTPGDLEGLSQAAGLEIVRIEYCSGVLSQKLTGFLRNMEKRTSYLVAWTVLLSFRGIPPLFDGLTTRLTRWPGYSITLVARRN
jgi:2-polyprenyl-3-methyl-5-hydroxy-6-metoxy-1,4-benzoquinol methylase